VEYHGKSLVLITVTFGEEIAKSGKWQEFGKVRFRSVFHFWAGPELPEKRHEKGSPGNRLLCVQHRPAESTKSMLA
jgi:hypothetical protein